LSAFSGFLDKLNLQTRDFFGETVTYTHTGGQPVAMMGIRRDTSTLESISPGTATAVWFRASDFPIPPTNGDYLSIGSRNYTVVDIREDAGGGLTLSLVKR